MQLIVSDFNFVSAVLQGISYESVEDINLDDLSDEFYQTAFLMCSNIGSVNWLIYLMFLIPFHYLNLILFYKKTMRNVSIFDIQFIIDCFLFFSSILFTSVTRVQLSLKDDEVFDKEDRLYLVRVTDNLITEMGLFECAGLIISLLYIKYFLSLRLSKQLGLFIEILKKVIVDILKFMVIYFISLFGFSIVFYLTQVTSQNEQFKDLPTTMITLFSASLGQFSFSWVDDSLFSIIVLAIFLLFHLVILLNLMIAILTFTYEEFHKQSLIKYLNEIVVLRNHNEQDENFGCAVSYPFPLSLVFVLFYFVVYLFKAPKRLNAFLLTVQFFPIMMLIRVCYYVFSLLLIVPAYLYSILHKFVLLFRKTETSY